MLNTVEGTFQGGKVELSEQPAIVTDGTKVLVTFLPTEIPTKGEPIRFGMLRMENAPRQCASVQLQC
jgi:hypothetical protein